MGLCLTRIKLILEVANLLKTFLHCSLGTKYLILVSEQLFRFFLNMSVELELYKVHAIPVCVCCLDPVLQSCHPSVFGIEYVFFNIFPDCLSSSYSSCQCRFDYYGLHFRLKSR
jgi:hypothetical protein